MLQLMQLAHRHPRGGCERGCHCGAVRQQLEEADRVEQSSGEALLPVLALQQRAVKLWLNTGQKEVERVDQAHSEALLLATERISLKFR